jgi:hypothetical protein
MGTAHAEATNAAVHVTVKEVLADKSKYVGKEIVLEGFVTDFCKKRGCWAMLHDTDSDAAGQIRVKQEDAQDGFKAFLPEIQGKTVLVTGKLHESRIDKDYLDKWEAKVKEAEKNKTGEAAEQSPDATLKQIAALRERLATSKSGYLSSLTLAVSTWEPKPDKQ